MSTVVERMLRVKAISPIHLAEEEVARRRERYRRLAPAGVSIDVVPLPPAAPALLGIERPADVRRSEDLVAQAVAATDAAAHDLVLPDCVLDPVAWRRGGMPPPLPVVGMLRLTVAALDAVGVRFGVVGRTTAIAEELRRLLDCYHAVERCVGVRVLDLPVDAMADGPAWSDALEAAARDLVGAGADVVVNGCSAVDVGDGTDPRLVDPAATALRMLPAVADVLPVRTVAERR